jgi:hypothetical protein
MRTLLVDATENRINRGERPTTGEVACQRRQCFDVHPLTPARLVEIHLTTEVPDK